MRRIFLLLLVGVSALGYSSNYTPTVFSEDPIQAHRYVLSNGLTVYLSQNKEKPEIQTVIGVRVGSQNDPLNSTGLAHYQEHIMFKGTSQYGTTDYVKEKPILDQIDALYEEYSKTTDADKRAAIYHQIDSLSYEGSKIAIANEFDKLMSSIGATGVNAFTSNEMTCYHEVIPSGELTRWAMIESGRFKDLIVRGFHTELETVYEEFNMYSTMDQDKVMLAIDQILYSNIPYRQHTVIGTQEHLKNPSLYNIKNFYQTYYRPNNVVICLSGDLEYNQAISIIDQYFGDWKPNQDLSPFKQPKQARLTSHKDTTIYGKEAAEVWMAWTFPNIKSTDIDAADLISEVLKNGKCGLMDINIDQKQTMLYCDAGIQKSNDYSTFYLVGAPKNGQTLEEVRALLLEEIGKLKRGEFSDKMLQGIITNIRRHEMENLQSNRSRAFRCAYTYIYDLKYEDVLHEIDRKQTLKKRDLVLAAQRYFTDSYACVYKQQGENVNPTKVEKPSITPIEMNRDAHSQFYTELTKMKTEKLKPQYLNFDEDLRRVTLNHGQELLYCENKENDLFSLDFVVKRGYQQDPILDLATDILGYSGTEKMSIDALQKELYQLAAEANVYTSKGETHFHIYGLQENFDQTLRLLEDWVLNAKATDAIYQEVVKDRIKSHNDSKSDQRTCFSKLTEYAKIGKEAVQHETLTPKQMNKLNPAIALDRLRGIVPGISYITYYGPAVEEDITLMMNHSSQFVALGSKDQQINDERVQDQEVVESEIVIAPFDANNVYLLGYANWGEVYDPKDEAIVRLFNEYFNGSMGSVVFQEMRESRALCYTASAGYNLASRAGENNTFFTFILSQNDKMVDCIQTFDSICDELPISSSSFEQAKTSLLKNIEKRRYVRDGAIHNYIAFREKGWDHDRWEDIYKAVQKMTIDDVVKFQKERVANRTYRFIILGNEKEIDMSYLKIRGKIKKVGLKDIFVY